MGFILFVILIIIVVILVRKSSQDDSSSKTFNTNDEILKVIEAADKDDPNAIERLDKMFDNGLTSERHNALRKKLYMQKAQNGDPNAQYWMGFLCQFIDRNLTQALSWYNRAAENGNTEAMRALSDGFGDINEYDPGKGFGMNKQKSEYWLLKAANAGDGKAQCKLGLNCSMADDKDGAVKWYTKATGCKDCAVRVKAYRALGDEHSFMLEPPFDYEPAKKMYIQALEQKQNAYGSVSVNDISQAEYRAYHWSDISDEFSKAANCLANLFKNEYDLKGNSQSLKRAAYCYTISYGSDPDDSTFDKLRNLPYHISEGQWNQWTNDGRNCWFHLPA